MSSLGSKINDKYPNINLLKVRSKNLDSFFSQKVRSLPLPLLQEIYFFCLIVYISHIHKYHSKSNIIYNVCVYPYINMTSLLTNFLIWGIYCKMFLFLKLSYKYLREYNIFVLWIFPWNKFSPLKLLQEYFQDFYKNGQFCIWL